MTHRTIQALVAALILVSMMFAAGCEDAPPNSYVPVYVTESFLIVDESIGGIKLTLSQPVTDTFRLRNAVVRDADVRVISGDNVWKLVYSTPHPDSIGAWSLPDTSVRVQPNTLYRLEIRTPDGAFLYGETMTPGRVAWTKPPRDTILIPPKDDPAYLNPPDSLKLVWTEVPGTNEYLISVRALDTLEYGRYLPTPTEEANRRINPDFDAQLPRYQDITRWGFLGDEDTPIVWGVFKWYGRQEVVVWAADPHFINWFKMTHWTGNAELNPLYANIRGERGVGVFASASVARQNVFVLMGE